MKMEIHSRYGVLIATPLKLQAIEESIPEVKYGANKDSEATVNLTDSCEASAEPGVVPTSETAYE